MNSHLAGGVPLCPSSHLLLSHLCKIGPALEKNPYKWPSPRSYNILSLPASSKLECFFWNPKKMVFFRHPKKHHHHPIQPPRFFGQIQVYSALCFWKNILCSFFLFSAKGHQSHHNSQGQQLHQESHFHNLGF